MQRLFFILIFIVSVTSSFAQVSITSPGVEKGVVREYEIGGVTISGVEHLDKNVLIMLSGLTPGERITVPGEKITKGIETLWKQGLFADIQVNVTNIQGDVIFLDIKLEERPRLSKFTFRGTNKSEADELREKIKFIRGQVVTESLLSQANNTVRRFYVGKGFLNAKSVITQVTDSTLKNHVILTIQVTKGKKVKINDIIFHDNLALEDEKLRRQMKETKRKKKYRLFKTSKFLEDNYEADKNRVIDKYNDKGYRDARIVWDTVYPVAEELINIEVKVDEGPKYYFRNINWVGNSKYTARELEAVLGIKKGDVYDNSLLQTRLFMNPNGRDVTSLYMDDGYLFFSVTPVEVLVENDSIDLEMRIYEGKQARVNKVTVTGNTKTHDRVIIREIRTKPGELFSRADLIRTQRELAQLGYFDPEKISVNPVPNPAEGTVDIEYVVEEKPSDQLEMSGGWGAGRVVGTLGVSFNNFSARNFFKRNEWTPLPSGDGQRLSVRAQSTGLFFQNYNFSFTEPWLGGRKPNSLTVSAYHTVTTNGRTRFLKNSEGDFIRNSEDQKVVNPERQDMKIFGISAGLGKRLKFPDDYFTVYYELSVQNYLLNNWPSFIIDSGSANNISLKYVLSRNSIDQPIYPRKGSNNTLTLQFTPPYSYLKPFYGSSDYSDLPTHQRFKWAEYPKIKFTTAWYNEIFKNMVLYTKAGFGFLGLYNRSIGITPFERFYMGGSGMSGMGGTNAFMLGQEFVALRGYEEQSVSPTTGASIVAKYTAELRYPLSLNPSATVFGLVFAEGGNAWNRFRDFNPFSVKRSAGAGVRVFLPMFGLLGFDFGYGLDRPMIDGKPQSRIEPHFSIGFNLGEL